MKFTNLEDLKENYMHCRRCEIASHRTQVVWALGEGTERIMLIGEEPGREEDREGIPFVGESGKVLNHFLKIVGLQRNECYITNTVLCFSPERKATDQEVRNCRERLYNEIYLVDPLIILGIGEVAIRTLCNTRESVSSLRGQIIDAVIPGYFTDIVYPVFCIFHPAYLLRNRTDREDGPWKLSVKDFRNFQLVYKTLLRERSSEWKVKDL